MVKFKQKLKINNYCNYITKYIWLCVYYLNVVNTTNLTQLKQIWLKKKTYSNFDINIFYNSVVLKNIKKKTYIKNKNTLDKKKLALYKNNILYNRLALIELFLKKYIEQYLNLNVCLSFERYDIKFCKKKYLFIKVLRKRLKRLKRLLNKSRVSLKTFLNIFIILLYSKDIDMFVKLLKKVLQNMHFKSHKKFLYFFKIFITKSMYYYFSTFNFKGFYFYISGKISCAGNSKTRKYIIRSGRYSFTSKNLKLKHRKDLIFTKTGVLGFSLFISYI